MILTPRGILLLFLAAPLLAAGTWLPFMQWLGGGYIVLAIIMILIDWRLAGDIHRFQVARTHDNRLSLGAENPVNLSVRNFNRRMLGFWIRDEAPEEFQVRTLILQGEALPMQQWEGIYHVRPLRRGDYHFGNINLRWNSPLGLVLRQGRLPATESVKVYPNLLDVRRYDLLLRRNRLQEMGLRHARVFGQGTEYESLREYLPDDDFRRIDWKATARRRRPVTIEYQTERSQNIIAVLDTGRMMQSPVEQVAKLDYVINAVLLLAYVATGKGDKVGLLTFADEVTHFLSPQQGRRQFYKMLEQLYAVEAQPVEPDYPKAFGYLAQKQRKRSLVVIFTELSGVPGIRSLTSHVQMLARNSLPLVVTISDPDIHAAAHQIPQDSLSVYQRAEATQLLEERRLLLDTLHRQGVLTLDVPANQLSMAVINRYLELKAKTLL
jgi:uncharacterized protein (DUF58 family)